MTTTPLDKTESSNYHYIWTRGLKQSPITDTPLAYRSEKSKKGSEVIMGSYPPIPQHRLWSTACRTDNPSFLNNKNGSSAQPSYVKIVYSEAFSKFRNAIGPSSQLGTSLVEGRESLLMIAQRAQQLHKAYSSLKKGNFQQFVRTLKVRPLNRNSKTKWTRPRDASSIWLEYWMGWAPLIGDIGSSIEVIQNPIDKPIKVEETAVRPYSRPYNKSAGNGFYSRKSTGSVDGRAICKIGAEGVITNPNLYLANQLGFVNPLSIAWEVVPFSFIVDWFANIGTVIGGLSWDAGITWSKSYSTVYLVEKGEIVTHYKQPLNGSVYNGSLTETWQQHAMRRDVGIATPSVVVRLPNKLSATRAATSISLLISLFTKG